MRHASGDRRGDRRGDAGVAQQAEQRTRNAQVSGSTPLAGSIVPPRKRRSNPMSPSRGSEIRDFEHEPDSPTETVLHNRYFYMR